MLELVGVTKTFDGNTAVHPTSLEIPAAATTVLIGPSGCGKSTLLRMMIGLVRPDAGSVTFEDESLAPGNLISIRQRLGYVIQDGGLFPHLTARGNAGLLASYLGWSNQRIAERLEELTELTHFPGHGLDRFPHELSGGERQRVSLMRALMLDPDMLLLDEPLGALDPMIRYDLQTDLKEIFERLAKTVVLVTHDMGEASFFGHQIVLMRSGRIVQQGTVNELLHAPADPFVSQFINAQRTVLDSRNGVSP